MNIRVTGAKLPRLNTIITTQVERVKLAVTLKSQYKDATQILVKDNGGLCLDYTPVFGTVVRAQSIRLPRTSLEAFNAVEENRELDPVAVETLKAQLDAWIDTAVNSQAIEFTESDIVHLVSAFGHPTKAKIIYKYQVNGELISSALERSASVVTTRREIRSVLNSPLVIPTVDRNAILTAILKAVNGEEELTAADPQLFEDEIKLPDCKFVEGHVYIVHIRSLALDYFGTFEFKIGQPAEPPSETEEPPVTEPEPEPENPDPEPEQSPVETPEPVVATAVVIEGVGEWVIENGAVTLTAAVTPVDAVIETVVWEVEGHENITITPQENQLVADLTATEAVEEGAELIVTVTVNGTLSDSFEVTVIETA